MSATEPVLATKPDTAAPAEPWVDELRPNAHRPRGLRRSSWPTSGRWVQAAYVLTDGFFVCANVLAVVAIRFLPATPEPWQRILSLPSSLGLPLRSYIGYLLLYGALIVMACQAQSLYRTVRSRDSWSESLAVLKAVTFATVLLTGFLFLVGDKSISRLVVVFSGILNAATLVAWRLWKRSIVERRVAQGIGVRNALIVGAGRIGQALAAYLQDNKHLGYVVKGFLDGNHSGDPRMLGRIEDLVAVSRAQYADEVFITIPSERNIVKSVALEAIEHGLDVKVVPEFYDGLGWKAPIRFLGDYPVMELHREPIPTLGLCIKRTIDVVGSLLALLILVPVYAILAVAIRVDSAGPIIYRSRRMGKKGREFVCYKFRTMVADADALKDELRQRNERKGPFFKIAADPRITRVGRLLRRYSLDELPQFWNVLKGQMSLVGPRPHPMDDYERYAPEHRRRLDVKPGITGLWQVTAREDPSFATSMLLDLEYIENWSLWLDVKLLMRTVQVALRGTGN